MRVLRSVVLALTSAATSTAAAQTTVDAALGRLAEGARIRVAVTGWGKAPLIGTLRRVAPDSVSVRIPGVLPPKSIRTRDIAHIDTSGGRIPARSTILVGTLVGGMAGGLLFGSAGAAAAEYMPRGAVKSMTVSGILAGALSGALVGALVDRERPRERWVRVADRYADRR